MAVRLRLVNEADEDVGARAAGGGAGGAVCPMAAGARGWGTDPRPEDFRLYAQNIVNRALFTPASDRWSTPRELYASLNTEFCFDFDPCLLDGDGDGLAPLFCSWRKRRVFCKCVRVFP